MVFNSIEAAIFTFLNSMTKYVLNIKKQSKRIRDINKRSSLKTFFLKIHYILHYSSFEIKLYIVALILFWWYIFFVYKSFCDPLNLYLDSEIPRFVLGFPTVSLKHRSKVKTNWKKETQHEWCHDPNETLKKCRCVLYQRQSKDVWSDL